MFSVPTTHAHPMCHCSDAQDIKCPVLNGFCGCTSMNACPFCREKYPNLFPYVCQERNSEVRMRKFYETQKEIEKWKPF